MITMITGGTVIDGTGAEPKPHTNVIIENNTIKDIRQENIVSSHSSDTRVIDATGQYVLPGMMDMHIHICIPYHFADPRASDSSVTEFSTSLAAMHGLNNSLNLIKKGVSTIRDVGSHSYSIHAIKHLIDTKQIFGPRIIPCGKAITMTGGHSEYMSVVADGPEEVRKAVRGEFRKGAGALKFMGSGSGCDEKESPFDVHFSQ